MLKSLLSSWDTISRVCLLYEVQAVLFFNISYIFSDIVINCSQIYKQ